MPTLNIVKADFIKVAKWGAIALGVLVALFILLKVLIAIKEFFFPSPPPPPTVSFGKLPKIFFAEGIKKNFTYELDTISGTLPVLPDKGPVYKMEQLKPDILAAQRASEKVSALDFNPHPQQISDFLFRWQNPNPPLQKLILNVKLAELNLSSSFLSYESELSTKNFTDKSKPISQATSFLQTLQYYPEDIDSEKTRVEFSSLQGGVIRPTTRAVTSNLATVYFFQKDKNGVPIVYPGGIKSTMRLVVAAGDFFGDVVDGSFFYQKTLGESATYPIKTAEQAFEELKNSKAYVASHTGADLNVLIKKVYLGLYVEGRIQKNLTPVIVFEGNNDFRAYVPAITDEWFDK